VTERAISQDRNSPDHRRSDLSGPDRSEQELDRLAELAEDVIRRARAAGASQAEVAASIDTGLSVNVRLGEVETVEHTRDRGFGLTVYFGQRKGSASTADLHPDSIQATLDQACAIARYTEADPAAGLADASRMATSFPDLDLWHPWDIDTTRAIELGIEIEDAGRAHAGISNSDGASVQAGQGLSVYANSHGFVGRERGTRHSLSLVLIAGDEDGMQRDYWYDSVRAAGDFMSAKVLGDRAAERTLARMGARGLSTRQCPVLFAPELARGLIGHLLGAVSGGALYRQASFLLDHVGKPVMPSWLNIMELPQLLRGQGSGSFDAEGVATRDSALIEGGVLARYVLGSYSARKLGLESTGNAGGIHNLIVAPGSADHAKDDFAAMLKRMDTGLLVTEVMGQGVSTITGDYSRGAAGFWAENGQIAYPVEEITIAANLREMFAGIVAVGTDVDLRSHILCGSILLDRLTIAGE
jgi:PmbA protein